MEAFNCIPIIPRDASFSDSGCIFPSSDLYRFSLLSMSVANNRANFSCRQLRRGETYYPNL